MIRWLYSLISYLANALVWIPALFNEKLRLGVIGRKQSFDILQSNINSTDRVIWMHVASLGEFEQGRPVLERLKSEHPNHKILLSFFSPSGYEPRKNYEYADVVCYLPLDTPANARRFLSLANPELVVFVKYEFWPNYLSAIKSHNCGSILISTVIHKSNGLLRYQRSWFVKIMNAFDYILTQDQSTFDLLDGLKLRSLLKVSGDTRVDRTLAIAELAEKLPVIEQFCGNDKVLIAGSSWTPDESHLLELYKSDHFTNWKMIIAPHDISSNHVNEIMNRFPNTIRYSQIENLSSEHRGLVIDNIGLLNKIYRYGRLAYIGGGFGAGIHNTLEPGAFNLPIIFGPKYQKFVEANRLVSTGGSFTYSDSGELLDIFQSLSDPAFYRNSSKSVQFFMESNRGATDDVMKSISKLIK